MFWNLNELPTIETERMTLRLPVEDDFEALAEIHADAETMTYIGGPCVPALTWRTLAAMIGHWCMKGFGYFVMIDRRSGRLIGRTGIVHPADWPAPELGWLVTRERWCEGLASEAARAVLAHETARIRPRRLISFVDPRNLASVRVAEKLGAFKAGVSLHQGTSTLVYVYDLPDAPLSENAPEFAKS